jgi:cbb3-type cytochrome oxidase subunit 3
MLQYFKDAFSDYKHAQTLQIVSLLLFVIFFMALIYFIWKRPKEYYKDESELPLESDEENEIDK